MLNFEQYLVEFNLTLKYHKKLNPKVWSDGKLPTDLKTRLTQLAYEFLKFSGVGKRHVQDIVVTGSNANFNYTKFSDIDVHILVKNPNKDSDFLHEKKEAWSDKHKDLTFNGYPLEFYIQDYHEKLPDGQGVYSIVSDEWLTSPKHLANVDVLKDPSTIHKVEFNIAKIKSLIKKGNVTEIKQYKDKLHTMRTSGLQRQGEFSIENIIYKELRNRGLLDKLNVRYKGLKGE